MEIISILQKFDYADSKQFSAMLSLLIVVESKIVGRKFCSQIFVADGTRQWKWRIGCGMLFNKDKLFNYEKLPRTKIAGCKTDA